MPIREQKPLNSPFKKKQALSPINNEQQKQASEGWCQNINSKVQDEQSQLDQKKIFCNGQKEKFYLLKVIGSGGFSRCYQVVDITDNNDISPKNPKMYALKAISKSMILSEQGAQRRLKKEILIHKNLVHENIVRFFGIFEDKYNYFLRLEICENQNLLNYLQNRGCFKPHEVLHLFRQIVKGVVYLHQNGILHRDLKPANILLKQDKKTELLHIKLADFGLARELKVKRMRRMPTEQVEITSCCGTSNYVSPQLLNRQQQTFASDIWALGVILYQLRFGKLPFDSPKSLPKTYANIKNANYRFPQREVQPKADQSQLKLLVNEGYNMDKLDELIRQIIADIFVIDVESRPSIWELNQRLQSNRNQANTIDALFTRKSMKSVSPPIKIQDMKIYQNLKEGLWKTPITRCLQLYSKFNEKQKSDLKIEQSLDIQSKSEPIKLNDLKELLLGFAINQPVEQAYVMRFSYFSSCAIYVLTNGCLGLSYKKLYIREYAQGQGQESKFSILMMEANEEQRIEIVGVLPIFQDKQPLRDLEIPESYKQLIALFRYYLKYYEHERSNIKRHYKQLTQNISRKTAYFKSFECRKGDILDEGAVFLITKAKSIQTKTYFEISPRVIQIFFADNAVLVASSRHDNLLIIEGESTKRKKVQHQELKLSQLIKYQGKYHKRIRSVQQYIQQKLGNQ